MIPTRFVIFLPVRNGGALLATAIESVLAQTRDDWHLVVLENQSTDGTPDLIVSYHDDRITMMPAERSLSIWENWNRGYRFLSSGEVTGDYATFIGHDDYFLPGFLEAIEQSIVSHPAASLHQTLFDIVDGGGRRVRPCRPIPERETHADFIGARAWGLRDSFGIGYVFRTEDYRKVGGIPDFPSLLFADDMLFARLMAPTYKNCHQTTQCVYRQHRSSTSAIMTTERFEAHIDACERFVTAITSDFPVFAQSDSGRAAIASLIAREIAIFNTYAMRRILNRGSGNQVSRLMNLFDRLRDGIPLPQWLNASSRLGSRYLYLRRVAIAALLVKSRLFA